MPNWPKDELDPVLFRNGIAVGTAELSRSQRQISCRLREKR